MVSENQSCFAHSARSLYRVFSRQWRTPGKLLSTLMLQVLKALDKRRGWFWYLGCRVYFPKRSLIHKLFRERGSFEPEVQYALSSFATDGTYVFDVGANIGLMSIHLLLQRPQVQVVSIEAASAAFDCLSKTHEAFSGRGRWSLVNKAATDKAGDIVFYECIEGNDALSGTVDTKRGGQTRSFMLPALTIDDLWCELGQPMVSVIKVDVEGAELAVLRGARACMAKSHPVVILEWWPPNFNAHGHNPADLISLAQEAGYRIFDIGGRAEIPDALVLAMQHALNREDFLMLHKDCGTSDLERKPGVLDGAAANLG